jgi:prepilin-type processing-associated H-X9-DG protein
MYHYPAPSWMVWNSTQTYGLALTSYNVTRNGTEMKTINGLLGWSPVPELKTKRSTFTPGLSVTPSNITFFNESNYHLGSRELDIQNENPYIDPVVPGGTAKFRIPHSNNANYAAMDGHVGSISRDLFGATRAKDRPFIW